MNEESKLPEHVEMYINGVTLDRIQKATGVSRGAIYADLARYGVYKGRRQLSAYRIEANDETRAMLKKFVSDLADAQERIFTLEQAERRLRYVVDEIVARVERDPSASQELKNAIARIASMA
jgi:hypothetical protein